jgi:hypothetical protein
VHDISARRYQPSEAQFRLSILDFSLDKLPVEVQWREKRSRGCAVLEMIVGAFVALFFLGLPLAIIGLFIASTLDRRNLRPPHSFTASQEPAASTSGMNYAGDKRRIVYGRYSVITTASAERYVNRHPVIHTWSYKLAEAA